MLLGHYTPHHHDCRMLPGPLAAPGPLAPWWHQPPEPPPWAEVALNVYELNGARTLNAVTETVGLGGAYHVGIEVYWAEWSYGWNSGGTGVHVVPIRHSRMGKFKERITLGRTPLTPLQVQHVLLELRPLWLGKDYHYLRQNCGHFCSELARRLHVGNLPDWVTSLAATGDWLSSLFRGGSASEEPRPLPTQAYLGFNGVFSQILRQDPMFDKNEREWRLAWEHSFKLAETHLEQDLWAHTMMGPPFPFDMHLL